MFVSFLSWILYCLSYNIYFQVSVSLTSVLWVCVWVAVDVMMDNVVLMAVVEFGCE